MASRAAEFRFYGSLADFVPDPRGVVERTFDVSPSIKDAIEACGVPHPEVDLAVVGGEPVRWGYRVQPGQRIAVYPRFRTFDVAATSLVHVHPLPSPRFVLDDHLGRLAHYLRLVGLDATRPAAATDAQLADASAHERRALLTRDVGLLKRNTVRHGYFVRSIVPFLQCVEVIDYYDLADLLVPFTRCLACNGVLQEVEKERVAARLPPAVRQRHNQFQRCDGCLRVYWRGSHFEHLTRTVAEMRRAVGSAVR